MTQIICFPLVSRNSPHNHFSLLTVLEAMDNKSFFLLSTYTTAALISGGTFCGLSHEIKVQK